MLPRCHVFHNNRQKRDEQVKDNETASEIPANFSKWKNDLQKNLQRDGLITCQCKYIGNGYFVEVDFRKQPEILPPCDG